MTPYASTEVTLLSLHERCRTGRETVQLCKNTITFLNCIPLAMHITWLTSIKIYYNAHFVCYLHYCYQNHYKQQTPRISLSCEVYSCTTSHGIAQLLYNVTVHYSVIYCECPLQYYIFWLSISVHHGLSPVRYAPHNTISYVWPKNH